MSDSWNSGDRRAMWCVVGITFLAYAYFFQGAAWNAMAHFDTIRAFAERGTAALTLPTGTGDVNEVDGRTYSNKPPGIAFLGFAPYRLLIAVERYFGRDVGSADSILLNLRLCTILLAALPAAMTNGLILYAFRREGASPRTALLLTGAFAFGTLNWPFGGYLTSHCLCAMLVFATWLLLSETEHSKTMAWTAAALSAGAVMTDLLAWPVTVVLAVVMARRFARRQSIAVCAGSCAGALVVMAYNRWVQGSWHSGVFVPPADVARAGLAFQLFGWPNWRQLYWITFQPMRGLFPTCPVFLICCMTPLLSRRPFRIDPSRRAIIAVLGVYAVFYVTYIGWDGGWCVGPRYLIPALPLLWTFARTPFERFPRICGVVTGLSIFQMLGAAAVGMLFPAPVNHMPDDSDPIRSDTIVLIQGHVNSDAGTENLGALMHIPERYQLMPVLTLLAMFYLLAWTRPGSRPGSRLGARTGARPLAFGADGT